MFLEHRKKDLNKTQLADCERIESSLDAQWVQSSSCKTAQRLNATFALVPA